MGREREAVVNTDREAAVDELLELGNAVDGLLAQQVELDIDALQRATGRTFSEAERAEICSHQQRAYWWTVLVSGLERGGPPPRPGPSVPRG
jgi:hypothetical protein